MRALIDPKDLPKPYGGELEWKFEDEPSLDDEALEVLGELPKGPSLFVDSAMVRPEPIPVPTDKKKN